MILLVLVHGIAALLAPVLLDRIGRRAFMLLALVPGGSAIWFLTQAPAVFRDGSVDEFVPWVSQLGLHLDFRLDALSWTMAMIVTGVGALVLIYCAAYFSATAKALGRFGGVFVAFAGAMLGLVTTDNTLMMYVFWELTTVFSYLLIGHYHERQASRRAASQAIFVTTFGGLAMLAGIIGLAELPGGSYELSRLIENGAQGIVGPNLPPWSISVLLVLILLGAISKSALIPFHFWLPAAMAAPTPVSAYLHAAAMVKAGVYLVARFAPGFGTDVAWHTLTLWLGLGTMLLGGYRALRQHDLKLILAFGTVSQLGMLIAVLGYGTAATALAGMALLVGHSMFKSALFLTVGVIDWSVGTRDMRKLSKLRTVMPTLAIAAAIATGSMIGLPPMAGFVAKEGTLTAFADAADWGPLAVLVLGSVITFAYGLRFWFGAFGTYGDLPGTERAEPRYRSKLIVAPIVVLTVITLVLGIVPAIMDGGLMPYAELFPGDPGHLVLWHGFTLPLALTVLVVLIGTGIFLIRDRVERFQERFEIPSADSAFRATMRWITNFSADVTAVTQRGSLPTYLMVILAVVVVGAGGVALTTAAFPGSIKMFDWWGQVPIALVAGATAWMAARARRRLKAVILSGVSGYAVALLYAVHGGPDIALTQVMVETVSLVIFVLVLRRLPTYFTNRPFARDRWVRVAIATLTGVAVSVIALVAVAGRGDTPAVSEAFPDATLEYGYGHNIVNVTLVDTRAWDTMGEVSVILVAATGVASLLFVRDRFGMVDSARNRIPTGRRVFVWGGDDDLDSTLRGSSQRQGPPEWVRAPHRDQRWLAGGRTLAPRRRSLIFEVGTRLIFPTLVVFSLYLLFAGHNQPGGGFAGGLVAGTALMVRYLAAGRYELGETLPLHAGYLLGGGLVVAAVAALTPLFFGGQVLQTAVFDFTVPVWGDVHLATALLFDIGVYLIVVGLVLDLLRSFGAEIDRHGELEGVDDDLNEEEDPEHDPESAPALAAAPTGGTVGTTESSKGAAPGPGDAPERQPSPRRRGRGSGNAGEGER
ncbi:MAG: Na+/H+ antiporter subunit A [bacterium]|nr:Na+/H+ antiporter subunit A [bacterium]